jgi:hypothetical protein
MEIVKSTKEDITKLVDDFISPRADLETGLLIWKEPLDWDKLLYSDNILLLCSFDESFILTNNLMDIIKGDVRFTGSQILLDENVIGNVLKSTRKNYSIEMVEFLIPFDVEANLDSLKELKVIIFDIPGSLPEIKFSGVDISINEADSIVLSEGKSPVFIYTEADLNDICSSFPEGTRIGFSLFQFDGSHYYPHLGHLFFMDEMLNNCDVTIVIFVVCFANIVNKALLDVVKTAKAVASGFNCNYVYFNTEQLQIPYCEQPTTEGFVPRFIEYFDQQFDIQFDGKIHKDVLSIFYFKEKLYDRIYNSELKVADVIPKNCFFIYFRSGKDYFHDRPLHTFRSGLFAKAVGRLLSDDLIKEIYYIPGYRLPDNSKPARDYGYGTTSFPYDSKNTFLNNIVENFGSLNLEDIKSILVTQSATRKFSYFIKNIITGADPIQQDLVDKKVGILLFGGDYNVRGEFVWLGFYPGLMYKHYPYNQQAFFNSTRNCHTFINQKLSENPNFEYVRKALKVRFFGE